ncbi:MAG TPA: hypothetical protein VEF92_08690 [Burkholderiales bacterium]|nr:hypothetical protein [Burkholderiales bacterium]
MQRTCPHGRRAMVWLCAALAVLSGCASDQEKHDAIVAVNEEFRSQYEAILAKKGARVYSLKHDDAFNAMSKALGDLGMQSESLDLSLGLMSFVAQAPTPLSAADWRATERADLPKLRKIVEPYIGWFLTHFIKFEPQGLQNVITATILDSPESGVQVSLTMRMREIEPPRSGMPRRDYPPPTGMRIGIDKVWARFDYEIEQRQALPRQPAPR